MISMTGFGSSEYQCDRYSLSVEVKSYNNRYLDIQVNAPSYISGFEQEIRDLVRKQVSRGHVDVNIRLKLLETEVEMVVDRPVVLKLREAFRIITEEAGIPDHPDLSHYLQNDEVLKMTRTLDANEYHDSIVQHLGIALDKFMEVRKSEGQATRRDLQKQLAQFGEQYAFVSDKADNLEERLRTSLTERFFSLVGEGYDENRILQEVAVLLNRYTINEELQRIGSHLKQFEQMLSLEEPLGKKLDFLCQELNREINTVASKSTIVEVNQAVVTMKDALENIREQLRNIE